MMPVNDSLDEWSVIETVLIAGTDAGEMSDVQKISLGDCHVIS